jgi:DNA-binding transcriptional LysR family regulator
LPAPLNDFHTRYPEVTLELHTGNTKELSMAVLTGELDAALVAEPVADASFEKVTMYNEELAIVASARHAPIRSPRDLGPQTIIAFEGGCPYRARLEQWFAQTGHMPERIIDMTSWHAILGCVAAGMGVALLPTMVLTSFPQRMFLSIHPLPPELSKSPTVMIWRKGTHSPKVAALLDVLMAHAGGDEKPAAPKAKRKRTAIAATRRSSNEPAVAA